MNIHWRIKNILEWLFCKRGIHFYDKDGYCHICLDSKH